VKQKKPKITIQELIDKDRHDSGISRKALERALTFFSKSERLTGKGKTIFVGSVGDAFDFCEAGNGEAIYVHSSKITAGEKLKKGDAVTITQGKAYRAI
jgi:hypothetical protein